MRTLQASGIEYEIVDLEGDLDGEPQGPARPRRLIPDELACLSGGLFDRVHPVEVPLDSFFPPPADGAVPPVGSLAAPRAPRLENLLPPPYHAQHDSLFPVESDAAAPAVPERVDARRAAVVRWSGIVTAAAVGMMVATALTRPTPQPAPQAAAPAVSTAPALNTLAPAAPAASPAKTTVAAQAVAPQVAAQAVKAAPRAKIASAAPVEAAPATEAAPAMEIAPSAPPPPDPLHRPEATQGVAPQRAAIAIAAAARGAASCLGGDDLRRTMAVSVTFAPSGRVTRATVAGGPHRGTAVGSCVAQGLRAASVPPFEGSPVTFHTSVTLR